MNTAKTIVLLNDAACNRGGGDTIAIQSAVALGAAGYRVKFLGAIGPAAAELMAAPNVEVTCLGQSGFRTGSSAVRGAITGLWHHSAATAVQRMLEGCDPATTVVHTHLYSSALSPAAPAAAIRSGFRTVLTLHDYFITCPNGAYFQFPRGAVCPHRPLSLSCIGCHCDSRRRLHKPWRLLRLVGQNVLARLPHRFSAFIAVSQKCRQTASRHLPANARIEVLPNPVSVEQTAAVDAARNRDYVFAGRLEDYKGAHLLAEAGHRTGLPVVFFGRGPMETRLREICPAAKLPGWLDRDALHARLRTARAFVFPSLVPETFGLAAAEALALGLPVIAAHHTAAAEFVHDGENGLLFECGNADDLARKLQLLESDELAARLARKAYEQYWHAPLTMERHIAALRPLYDSVLAAAPGK